MRNGKKKLFARWKKMLLALVLAGLFSYGIPFTAMLAGAHDQVQGQPQVMIILGCQVMEWGPSILLRDRLDRALEYLREHPEMTVVVSGGQGRDEPVSEAKAMADYLEKHGISRESIFMEAQSHSTKENFLYTARLLLNMEIDPGEIEVLLVSSGLHLTRARFLAGRAGFGTVSTLAAVESHQPSRVYMLLREPLAIVKSFFLDHMEQAA